MTIGIDKEFIADLDVRIQDGGHVSASLLDLFVHLSETICSKVLWVELKVLVTVFLTVIIGPLDIHPKYIDGELIVREVPVPLHDYIS